MNGTDNAAPVRNVCKMSQDGRLREAYGLTSSSGSVWPALLEPPVGGRSFIANRRISTS